MSQGAIALPLGPPCNQFNEDERPTSQRLSWQIRTTISTVNICNDYCSSYRRRARTTNIVPTLTGVLSMLATFDTIFRTSRLPLLSHDSQLLGRYTELIDALQDLTRYCSQELISELHDISDTLICLSLVKHAQIVMSAVGNFSNALSKHGNHQVSLDK